MKRFERSVMKSAMKSVMKSAMKGAMKSVMKGAMKGAMKRSMKNSMKCHKGVSCFFLSHLVNSSSFSWKESSKMKRKKLHAIHPDCNMYKECYPSPSQITIFSSHYLLPEQDNKDI
jgi:hypothetical protein